MFKLTVEVYLNKGRNETPIPANPLLKYLQIHLQESCKSTLLDSMTIQTSSVYHSRCTDIEIRNAFEWAGAILLEGPRGCGKTTTGLHHAVSSIRLDQSPDLAILAQEQPSIVLAGEKPRLIDEWQLAPALWNTARHSIDEAPHEAQFIFSGSATPATDATRHTGAGRFERLRMRTMSLSESGDSSGAVSLGALLEGVESIGAVSPATFKDLAYFAVRGGWPRLLGASEQAATGYNRAYFRSLAEVELPELLGVAATPERISRLLHTLSRNLGTAINIAKITREISADGRSVSESTIRGDLDALHRVFAYDPLPSWSADVRSRTRIRVAEAIHLADPALALATLGIGIDRLILQRQFFGFIFESMACRDLRAYAATRGGRLRRYRDSSELEVDFIIEYPGTWAAVEAKLGSTEIAKAEKNLLRLSNDRVDKTKMGAPAFLAIVTGTEAAYTLPSGVHVVPLATLTW